MSNKSKAARTRLENLTKTSAKVYKATVEECSDSDCQPGPDNDMWEISWTSHTAT